MEVSTQSPTQRDNYTRHHAANRMLMREYLKDSRKPWDEFVDELLDIVDNGAFNSVYEPKQRLS